MKQAFKIIFCLVLSLAVSGCIVRTYKQVREREDQAIAGNRGYLQGTPPPAEKASPKTRETVVVEVELKSPIKFEVGKPKEIKPVEDKTIPGNKGYISGGPGAATEETLSSEEIMESQIATQYTIKKDDTLQKISKQFYGTVKKWNRIYQANKDKIKDPNRIKPGVVLNIPKE
jgi:nucleoid-associated protein YgaU